MIRSLCYSREKGGDVVSVKRKQINKVVNYLLKCPQTNQQIILGAKAYSSIPKIKQETFLNALYWLTDNSYITLHFKGVNHLESPCYIETTIRFTNYIADYKRAKHKHLLSILWEMISTILPIILSIIAILISKGII